MVATDMTAPLRSPRRGLVLMITGVALFSILNGVVKAQMEIFPVNQVVFFRNFFSLFPLVLLLWLQPGGMRFRTSNIWLHVLLAVMFTVTLLAIFRSYTLLSLADATAINFTQPLMVILLSLVLGVDKVRRYEVIAVGMGLCGVLLMVRPGGDAGEGAMLGAAFGLCGAALSAGSMIAQRKLSMNDSAQLIAFYTLGFSALMVAPTLPMSWVTPTGPQLAGLIVMGLASGLCQYVTVRAFYHASASTLSPITYTKMFWAIVIGYFWFAEVPSFEVLLGASIVVGSTVIVLRSSARPPAGPA
ncbi:hypothetical protein ATO6_18900 [Oceanicola sp. 22II-s10i]|uniref:DMT family transporter n=1 Tax=Oceanicola sp. 22II-s10i TaxID=1317116 RepID=UPI000B524E56|nr:DMT family transporter [Oceanicola sp. 22II-s10i]OWU83493.1 hypothetical protein ATO6_18900 [Oceanicola sp. 22II-s10i]